MSITDSVDSQVLHSNCGVRYAITTTNIIDTGSITAAIGVLLQMLAVLRFVGLYSDRGARFAMATTTNIITSIAPNQMDIAVNL
jgi:hypothetical protein